MVKKRAGSSTASVASASASAPASAPVPASVPVPVPSLATPVAWSALASLCSIVAVNPADRSSSSLGAVVGATSSKPDAVGSTVIVSSMDVSCNALESSTRGSACKMSCTSLNSELSEPLRGFTAGCAALVAAGNSTGRVGLCDWLLDSLEVRASRWIWDSIERNSRISACCSVS